MTEYCAMHKSDIATNNLHAVTLRVGKERVDGCCTCHDKLKGIAVEILHLGRLYGYALHSGIALLHPDAIVGTVNVAMRKQVIVACRGEHHSIPLAGNAVIGEIEMAIETYISIITFGEILWWFSG